MTKNLIIIILLSICLSGCTCCNIDKISYEKPKSTCVGEEKVQKKSSGKTVQELLDEKRAQNEPNCDPDKLRLPI